MFKKNPARIWTHWLPACGIVGAMLYYAVFLYQSALNIPFADDIKDILLFLMNVSKSEDWSHTAELFFAQTNEHRTLSSRLVFYLAFLLQGEVNFRTLVFLANLGLPLILLMLYVPIRQRPNALLMLLPAALILFQLRIYGSSFWSMNAFAFFFVYFYGFASLVCLRQLTPLRFSGAILLAALATFTLASGQLIWLTGLACISHRVFVVHDAPKAYLVAWIVAAVLVLAVFHIDYQIRESMEVLLASTLFNPLKVLDLLFVLAGSGIDKANWSLARIYGAALLLVVVWISIRRWRADDITLELFAWYIALSIFAIALARTAATVNATATLEGVTFRDAAVYFAFAPRYTVLSVLLLATTSVLLVSQLPARGRTAINAFMVLLAFAYCVSSYHVSLTDLQEHLNSMVKGHNSKNYWAFAVKANESSVIVRDAENTGIYRAPQRPLPLPNFTGAAPSEEGVPSSAVEKATQ